MCLTSRTLEASRWYLFICSLARLAPVLALFRNVRAYRFVPWVTEKLLRRDVYHNCSFAAREKKSDSLLYS